MLLLMVEGGTLAQKTLVELKVGLAPSREG